MCLQTKLQDVLRRQYECISESGYVLNHKKHEYQDLVREAKRLRDAITTLNGERAKQGG